ncbi:MAG: hypothetical protein WA063_04980, partial [Minisyncoccia bacterium]
SSGGWGEASSGGGYGGKGGDGTGGRAGGPTYPSLTSPNDLGSGGGRANPMAWGGSGGGLIKLNMSGTLTNNGSINANGVTGGSGSQGWSSGGGAGGTVYISASTVTGIGTISSNGGNGGDGVAWTDGSGGGGGRIAIYCSVFASPSLTVDGGTGYNDGEDGTIFVFFPPLLTIEARDQDNNLIPDAGTTSAASVITVTSTAAASFPLQHHKIEYKESGAGSWTTAFDCWDSDLNGFCDSDGTKSISSLSVSIGSFAAGKTIEYQSEATDSMTPPSTGYSQEKSFITFGVANTPPTVTLLNPLVPNYCVAPGVAGVLFSWNYTDTEDLNIQEKYQLIISREDGKVYDSGVRTSQTVDIYGTSINSEANCVPGPSCTGFIDYGSHTYSWTIQVWDSGGLTDGPEPGNNFGPTPAHQYPDVGFAPPPPASFLVNFPIDFTVLGNADSSDNTKCYPAGDNTDCKQWIWDFDYDGATFTSDRIIIGIDGNWTHIYSLSNSSYRVVLQVTDNDDYTCSNFGNPEMLGATRPIWKEVVP